MNAVVDITEKLQPVDALAASLAKAQMELANPKFDSTNPHFKSKFASLAAVRNAIYPVFSRHGLSIIQDLRTTERGISCETIVLHSSGQRLVLGPLVMPATKPDAQGYGSAATYARRYALLAAAGVVGEEDDDGNAASKAPPAGESISDKQAADLEALITEVGADRAKFMKWVKVDRIEMIPAKLFETCVNQLQAKRK